MKALWLLIISGSLSGMDERTPVLPANFDQEPEIDSEEISDLALTLYFDQEDPELFQMVFPKVKAKLRDINTLPEVVHRAIRNDLLRLKEHEGHHRHSHIAQHHPDLVMYLNKIVYKSMKEAFKEERDYSNEIQRQKNCYKVAAIAGGIGAAILTASGTLVAHFVQPHCPTS